MYTFEKIRGYLFGQLIVHVSILIYLFSLFFRLLIKIWLKLFYKNKLKLVEGDYDNLYVHPVQPFNMVIVHKIKGSPDLKRIQKLFEERVLNKKTNMGPDGKTLPEYEPYECYRWKVVAGHWFNYWERAKNFDIKNHIVLHEHSGDTKISYDDEIKNCVSDCVSKLWTEEKPQWEWRIVLPQKSDCQEFAFVYCQHHSYGDGMSFALMFQHAVDDKLIKLLFDPLVTPKFLKKMSKISKIITTIKLIVKFTHKLTTIGQNFYKECSKRPLPNGGNDRTRNCTWIQVDVEKISKIMKGPNKVTFDAIVWTCISKAYERLIKETDGTCPESIYAHMTGALVPYPSLKPVNRVTSAHDFIPLGTQDRQELMSSITNSTKINCSIGRILTVSKFVSMLNIFPKPLLAMTDGKMGQLEMSLTHCPLTYNEKILSFGHEVQEVFGFPPLGFWGHTAACAVTYDNTVSIGLVTNKLSFNQRPEFGEKILTYMKLEFYLLVNECGI